jgi:hypothetical protein
MSTFTHTDDDGDELLVEADGVGRALVSVSSTQHSGSVYVPKAVAVSAALVLLESAGATTLSGAVSQAVVCLRSHLAYQAAEKRREEAQERAKALHAQRERLAREAEAEKAQAAQDAEDTLDEEALRLLNAYRQSNGMGPTSKAVCIPYIFGHWREVARASLNRA